MARFVVAAIWICFVALPLPAQDQGIFKPKPFDWPHWQGPNRDNRSLETGLMSSWPKDGPKLVWKATKLGGGYSAPSIAAGRIFGMSYQKDDEVVWALDERTGKKLWQQRIAAAYRKIDYREGSRCTPTVDGDTLHALGISGDLVSMRISDGKVLWRKNLVEDFGGILPFYIRAYGYSESPLIDGPNVVLTPGGPKNTMVALDKRTGKMQWSCSVPNAGKKGSSRANYASIAAGAVGGIRQYVQFLQGGLIGVNAANGKLLWRWDKPSNDIAHCTTPIFHKQFVLASSGYGKGAGLARLTRNGADIDLQDVWFTRAMKNVHGGLVLVNGYVYGNSDPGLLVCIQFATGKVMWRSRAPGKGSIIYADKHLYYRDEQGPILFIEANPKKYVEKGRFDPPHRSRARAWSHPVLANGRLYLRDQEALLCYDVEGR